jgi:hypothetical protein
MISIHGYSKNSHFRNILLTEYIDLSQYIIMIPELKNQLFDHDSHFGGFNLPHGFDISVYLSLLSAILSFSISCTI